MTYNPNKEPKEEEITQKSLENNNEGVAGQMTTSVQFPKAEKYEIDPKTQEDIESLSAEAKFRAGENGNTNEKIGNITYKRNNIIEKMEDDDQSTVKKPWFKRAAVAVAFTAASIFGAKAHGENLSDSTKNVKNKTEKITSTSKESREEVSSQLRLEWNKYIDWLASKGLRGDESLDHGGKGVEMVKQYMAEHPGTILSPEVIDDIQEEFAKYKDWSLKEIDAGRANFAPGTSKENYMRALSIIDGIPGQRTTTFKFPESYLLTFKTNTINYNTVAVKAVDSKLQGKISDVMNNDYNSNVEKVENKGFAKIADKNSTENSDVAQSNVRKANKK